MITQKQIQAILAAKWERKSFRSYFVKTANGRLIRFVDWRD